MFSNRSQSLVRKRCCFHNYTNPTLVLYRVPMWESGKTGLLCASHLVPRLLTSPEASGVYGRLEGVPTISSQFSLMRLLCCCPQCCVPLSYAGQWKYNFTHRQTSHISSVKLEIEPHRGRQTALTTEALGLWDSLAACHSSQF
jgi:hypothetical protein